MSALLLLYRPFEDVATASIRNIMTLRLLKPR